MKHLCIRMHASERVLDSYLTRVFSASTDIQGKYKTVRFPEVNLTQKNWNKKMLKNFCKGTVSVKEHLKLYKAKLNERGESK